MNNTKDDRFKISEKVQPKGSLLPANGSALAINILSVDDNRNNLLAIEGLLGDLGHNIISKNSSDEALKYLLTNNDVAVVLMGVMMPNMDGLETTALVRQRNQAEIPIIFLIAESASREHVVNPCAQGAVDYIFKPIVPEILKSKVTVFIELFIKTRALKHKTEENERLLSELSRSNREIQDFAYAASHDLKTPLIHIEKFATFVLEDEGEKFSDKARGMQQQICNASQRLGRMIDSLLQYAKVDAKPLSLEAVDLNDVASNVLSDLAEDIKNTGAQIEVGTLSTVNGEKNQLYQVLLNIVGNALKYHRPDITPIIKLSSRSFEDQKHSTDRQNMSQIIIEDNGIGFDESQVDIIFTSFKRLNPTNEFSGSGIGLSTTLKIVKRHHGNISAKSIPGKGSTFIVTLPLPPLFIDKSMPAVPQRLLIVDDNEIDLQILLRIFEGSFHIFTADNAEEALNLLTRDNIDIVLSDYNIPDRNGIWLLTQIKARFPTVRRFLYSSVEPSDSMNCDIIESFFLKPIQVGQIRDSLQALENEKDNAEP